MIPDSLFQLDNLKLLDVSNNKLISLPEMINHSICEFRASGNQIEGLPNIEMDSLENLDLKGNKIKELPACFGGLVRLRKLVLDENMLQVVPGFFGKFELLSDLSIAKNKLS